MKLSFILLFVNLFGCNQTEIFCTEHADFVVKNVCIYTNGHRIDDLDINRALDIVHANWYERFGHDEAQILDLYIDELNQASISLEYPFEYGGLAKNSYVWLRYGENQEKCIANTAIGHEFLHVLGSLFDMNYGHDNGELFINKKLFDDCYYNGSCESAKDSLENKINVELCNYFCSDSCFWWRVQ